MLKSTGLLLMIILSSSSILSIRAQSIEQDTFVSIGGIEQWITIKGADKSRHAILFIHGGPGSVLSPYAEAIFKAWKKDFVLINWDQRGAGRTFGRNAPNEADDNFWIENPLSLETMVEDGIEVTEFLLDHLGKQKIILIGTSWGSIIGTKMALKKPELFHAYIGHSQIVSFNENLKFAYQKTSTLARMSGDTTAVRELESLGEPPYSDARDLGQMLRHVKKYEDQNVTPAPTEWWEPTPEYNNETDNRDRYNGDDYSFLYFAGHEKPGIKPMAEDVDFNKDGLIFKIPVILVQGRKDILTSKKLSKPYFDLIKAPDKKYYVVDDAAHGFNQSVIDRIYQILQEYIPVKATTIDKGH